MSMSAQEYDSAPNEDGPPMHPEAMAKFEEMFGDLLLEVKEGRLSQEEGVQAMELPRTVNGTGHTGPSEFCATSI